MDHILKKLKGGDRRSIGRVSEVVAEVLDTPILFKAVFDGMLDDDPVVRMRSADAVEKITVKHPEYLQPHKTKLIQEVARIAQQEVRWHVAQMFPRLVVSEKERAVIVEILFEYLHDKSRIARTFSMEALAVFAEGDTSIRSRVVPLLEELTRKGSPAMKSRGRRLLERLNRQQVDETILNMRR